MIGRILPSMAPFIFLLLLSVVPAAFTSTITFNSSAGCVASQICSFNDNSTWIGGIVPGANDTAVISNVPVTIVIGGNITVNSIQMNGSVTLLLSGAALSVHVLKWDATSMVNITQGSNVNAFFINGFSLYTYGSSVSVTAVQTLSFLGATLSSIQIGSMPYSFSMNITDSSFSCPYNNGYLPVINVLYSTGNVSFDVMGISIGTLAVFSGNPNLNLTGNILSISANASVTIIDCPSQLSTVYLYYQSKLIYLSSTPATQSHSLGGLVILSTNSLLELGSNINLTLVSGSGSAGKYAALVMEEDSILNVQSYQATFSSLQQAESSIIQVLGRLQFATPNYAVYYANVYVTETGEFDVSNSQTILSFEPEECGISGPGRINIGVSGSLNCSGELNIGTVYLSGTLIADTVVTSYLYPNYACMIDGDVELSDGGIFINFITLLTITGEYTQHNGLVSVSLAALPNTPMMTVHGSVSLSKVNVTLSYAYMEQKDKIPFAKSEHFSVSVTSMENVLTGNRLIFTTEEEISYIVNQPPPYFATNWPWLVVIAVMALVLLLTVFCLDRSNKNDSSSLSRMEKHDPHATLSWYFRSMDASRLFKCDYVTIFILSLFLGACFVEAAALTLALAVFIPLGFFFGIIEHRFVFLWAVITLFIQAGGMLDLFADIALVAKFLVLYIDDFIGVKAESEWDDLTGQEWNLFLARVCITMGGSLVSLFFLYALASTFGSLLDRLSGIKFWNTNNQKASGAQLPAVVLFIAVMFWKMVLLGLRMHLLYSVAKSLIKHRKLEQSVQWKVQWIEIILFFDLMWTGIPLGVLTALDLFVYREDFIFDGDTVFELLKLSALAIDIVGASFLFYYIVLGLMHKVPCLAHHDNHHSHDDHGHLHHEDEHTKGGHGEKKHETKGGHDEKKHEAKGKAPVRDHQSVNVREDQPLLPK